MRGEYLQERTPTRRKLGDADNLNPTQNRRSVSNPSQGASNEIGGTHHAGRQLGQNRGFQARDRVEPRMIAGACGQIDSSPPRLMERVGSRIDHARKQLDAFQLSEGRVWQHGLDRSSQTLIINRAGESAGQTDRELFE